MDRSEALRQIGTLLARAGRQDLVAELTHLDVEAGRSGDGLDAERQLARSESRFRGLIENMPDGVIVRRQGIAVYMSPSGRRMLGYEDDDPVEGMVVLDMVHPEDRATVATRMNTMDRNETSLPPTEMRLLRKDGTSFVAEVAAHSVVFDGQDGVLVTARDASLRKEVEAQLILNARLASLGRLSASIGHELNTPLAYVLGNLDLMERVVLRAPELDEETTAQLRQHIRIIRDGAGRMRDVVRDLKALGQGDVDRAVPVALQNVLQTCVNMVERDIARRARLVGDFETRAVVAGSEALLGQVFLNLLLNAAQAIPEGQPEANEVRLTVYDDGAANVRVEVFDTGAGIPPENRDRIFEPFFTTKDRGGTGLGLSICHRIVTSCGGTLTVHANVGRGTVFRVVLPTVRDDEPVP